MPVCNQLFHNFPVHKRLTAEKVNFQIFPKSRIIHKEIERLFPGLIGHQSAPAVILTFFCKTVPAGKVAVVCYMKAQRFHNSRTFHEFFNGRSIRFRGEERALVPEFFHFLKNFLDLGLRIFKIILAAFRTGQELLFCILRALRLGHDTGRIIKQVIRDMDRAARHIQDDIVAVTPVSVYLHLIYYLSDMYFLIVLSDYELLSQFSFLNHTKRGLLFTDLSLNSIR